MNRSPLESTTTPSASGAGTTFEGAPGITLLGASVLTRLALLPLTAAVTIVPVALGPKFTSPPYDALKVYVPPVRFDVVNVATPLISGTLAIEPFWSLKLTVPPVGGCPPPGMSLTVAVKVIGCPRSAEATEAWIAVRVDTALKTVRCSRNATCGWNSTRAANLPDRRLCRPFCRTTLVASVATSNESIGTRAERCDSGLAQVARRFDGRTVDRISFSVAMMDFLGWVAQVQQNRAKSSLTTRNLKRPTSRGGFSKRLGLHDRSSPPIVSRVSHLSLLRKTTDCKTLPA